jgi:hypothetical protein
MITIRRALFDDLLNCAAELWLIRLNAGHAESAESMKTLIKEAAKSTKGANT